ncbi:hypothetical protein LEP1GSC068_3713 [Leptospira sp. Fiocruz LV3954]|nr:hypothetical protein LEP1GSC068_3713 [Leptospira sp. Fiocruz LV3954]EMI66203.1 hypothetical protein LEP1GSC076_2809 [Leptospira sp. Fiocruz LV4135]EMO83553.1 hypothetical protein LEP1GSC070_0780 [Leptospira santarosai str. AIM]EPG84426.1 hypothetical protein LEP1GSC048_3428 [Leptospira santarosai serovar Shermani str. 1342KT]
MECLIGSFGFIPFRVFDFTGPDSMSSYIPDLQEDFIRFLRFVALFEVCK